MRNFFLITFLFSLAGFSIVGAFDTNENQATIIQVKDCHTTTPGSGTYCTSACPCDDGFGDCDIPAHCKSGNCVFDVGAKYGYGQYIDICLPNLSQPKKEIDPSILLSFKNRLDEISKKLSEIINTEVSQVVFVNNDSEPKEEMGVVVLGAEIELDPTVITNAESALAEVVVPTEIPLNALSLFISPDSRKADTLISGSSNVSVLKFDVYNTSNKNVAVNEIGLILKGTLSPRDLEEITWKANGSKLGVSYFTSYGNIMGFINIFNVPIDEEVKQTRSYLDKNGEAKIEEKMVKTGNKITPPLFTVEAKSSANVEILINLSSRIEAGKEFILSIPDASYFKTDYQNTIIGIPLKSSKMGIMNPGCYDTDAGINEYAYGEILNNGAVVQKDTCYLGDNLQEWACTAGGMVKINYLECPNGCVDGVCKKALGNNASTNVICKDSDGKDYGVAGTLLHGYKEFLTEKDYCEDTSMVRENYCDNGYYAYELYKCKNGCLNGACIADIVDFKIID